MSANRGRALFGFFSWGLVVLGTSPAASAEVRLAKGPYVTDVFETGAEVRFELDQKSPAAVTVVREQAFKPAAQVFQSRDIADMHVVRVTGLDPATRYAYDVRAGNLPLGAGHFTTAPDASSGAPVTFLVYGDDRTDPIAHAAVVRGMLQVPSTFLVNTGDMVEDGGSEEDWQTFFEIEAPLLRDRPIFVAIGNHELFDDGAGSHFARYFGFSDASRRPRIFGTARVGPLRMFFLNAMHDWGAGEERDWLTTALGRADAEPGVVWRIAVTHHGPSSSGPHGPNDNFIDAHIPELLAAHHVDLVLSGHDHIYERGRSGAVNYVVSGGGGAPLYRVERAEGTMLKAESTYHFVEVTVTREALRVLARRVDGTVLDQCGFGPGQPWDCDPPGSRSEPEAGAAVRPPRSSSGPRCGCREVGAGASDGSAFLCSVLIALGIGRRYGWPRRLGRPS